MAEEPKATPKDDAKDEATGVDAATAAAVEVKDGDAAAAADGESKQGGDDEEKSRRVYIGNLSWGVSWQDLKDHMREAGEVTRADIMTGPDGRSKGCGIVEYSTVEEAKKAVLTLNDTELNGRQIFVREDREERGSRSGNRFSSDETAQSRRVYVGNLSWDVAWQDLKDHMVSSFDTLECLFSPR
jgi:RNA recognition motif-containing protein